MEGNLCWIELWAVVTNRLRLSLLTIRTIAVNLATHHSRSRGNIARQSGWYHLQVATISPTSRSSIVCCKSRPVSRALCTRDFQDRRKWLLVEKNIAPTSTWLRGGVTKHDPDLAPDHVFYPVRFDPFSCFWSFFMGIMARGLCTRFLIIISWV